MIHNKLMCVVLYCCVCSQPVITAALATDADKRCSLADIECALDQAMQDMQAAEQRAAQQEAQRQAWAAFSAQATDCQATGLALV